MGTSLNPVEADFSKPEDPSTLMRMVDAGASAADANVETIGAGIDKLRRRMVAVVESSGSGPPARSRARGSEADSGPPSRSRERPAC